MTPQIQRWIKKVKKDFIKKPGKLLEIGSLDINGGVKNYFKDAQEYTGIDSMAGPGVNKVLNAHDISKVWKDDTFDTILCLEMLEHDDAPWVTISNMHQALKQGGYLVVSTPTFGFPLHRYPKDYFRYGVDAFKDIIFKDFKILRISKVKDILGNPGICCIGQKT